MTYDYTDDDTTSQGVSTVAGVAVRIEVYELMPAYPQYNTTYYIDNVTGLVFKQTGMSCFEVTSWDTSVLGFGDVVLPD